MCPEETSTDPKSYQPPVYDYGVNVIYQGDDVYVDGKKTATAAEYSQQAIALANEPATPPPPPTRPEPGQQPQWLPIPDEARTYCHAKVRVRQLGGATIGPSDHRTIGLRLRLVRTFDLAPTSGRVALGGPVSVCGFSRIVLVLVIEL
jgi:hypothetical protein